MESKDKEKAKREAEEMEEKLKELMSGLNLGSKTQTKK
jgi:hypothetical protein